MALISISFAISLLTYHLLQKFSFYDKIVLWFAFRKLQYFSPPSKDDLKAAAGIGDLKHKGNKKHRRQEFPEFEKVLVPKTVDVDLMKRDLYEDLISALHYHTELKWLLNVSVTAVISYIITEVYYVIKDWIMNVPNGTTRQVETNFSLLWCIVTAFLCIFLLGQLIFMYYRVEGHGELFTVVLAGVIGAFLSMGMLVVNEKTFDFGLKAAHKNFTEDFMKIPQVTELARTINFSLFGFGLLIGILSGATTALIAFPGIRFGKLYRDARDSAIVEQRKQDVAWLGTAFGLPAFQCVLWMPVIRQNCWTENNYISFETARILAVLALAAVRFYTMPLFLQANLDLPRKILSSLKKEPGRIDADDLRRQLGIPLRYTAVTAVQYSAVLIMLVMLSFLYLSADLESFFPVRGNLFYYNKMAQIFGQPEDFISGAVAIHNAVWTLFTGALLKAVFGYLIWWIIVSHFLFSMFAFYVLQDRQ